MTGEEEVVVMSQQRHDQVPAQVEERLQEHQRTGSGLRAQRNTTVGVKPATRPVLIMDQTTCTKP